MAFNINAQVVLSGPKNLNKISKQIQQGIGKSGTIKVAVDSRSLRNIRALNTTVGNLNTNITNLNNSANTLKSTLSGVNSGLSKANSTSSAFNKNQQQTASSVNNVNNALQQQSKTLGTLGKRFVSTAKTAVAFGLISRPIYDLQRAFIGATKDAVEFQKEIVKISQVTGTSVKNLTGLSDEINRLATTLGVSANELAETSRIIAQTGRSAAEIQPILNALARSTLAPTFGKITDTTEGLIAALGQFQLEASQSEQILGSLNRVSKNFAVEAEDLISVIRRTGGVFAQAAGDSRNTVQALQELAAIFTAVRSTTRESADTIAAGLRTIFSRIQRRGTIEFLEQFGVQLTNVKGEFIGIFPAFDELSRKLSTLIQQGDALTLSAIAEELGGIRQIGKLLPAIAQFDKARAALEQAQKGAVEGLGIDVAKGLDTVDNRIRRVKESFDELIRTVFESDAFQNFTKGVLTSAESILKFGTKVVESLEPILPLLQGIGAVKLGQAIGGFVGGGGIGKVAGGLSGQAAAQASQAAATASQSSAQATQANTQVLNTINATLQRTSNQLANIFQSLEGNFRTLTTQMSNLIQAIGGFSTTLRSSSIAGFAGGVRRRSGGGKILGFNRGGMVPGTGNGDTVPAMLEAGEFVIKKSSVNSLGADTLQAMNENRYEDGTPRTGARRRSNRVIPSTSKGRTAAERAARNRNEQDQGDANQIQSASFSGKFGLSVLEGSIPPVLSANIRDVLREAPAAGKQRLLDGLKKTGKGIGRGAKITATNAKTAGLSDRGQEIFQNEIFSGIPKIFDEATRSFTGTELDPGTVTIEQLLSNSAIGSIKGQFFEAFVRRITGNVLADNTTDPIFDFETVSNIEDFKTLFGGVFELPNEFKNIANSDNIASAIGKGLSLKSGSRLQFKNSGGSISGQDTVPALLTPGEFVFNKKSAGRIGYSTLNAMNKKGVQGFNKGGVVGYNKGGSVSLQELVDLEASAKTGPSKFDLENDNNKSPEVENALSDLAGVAVSASFAVSSLTASFEDGKLTTDELFNNALLLAPVIPAISSTMAKLKPSFEKFKTELSNTRGALAKTKKVLSGTGGRVAAGGLALAGAALTTVEGEGSGAIAARGAGAGLTAGFGAAAVGIPAPIAAVIGLSAGLFSTLDGFIKASSPLPNALNELSKSSKFAADNLSKISPQAANAAAVNVFKDANKAIEATIMDMDLSEVTSRGTSGLGSLLSGAVDLGATSEERGASQEAITSAIQFAFKNANIRTIFQGATEEGRQKIKEKILTEIESSGIRERLNTGTKQELAGSGGVDIEALTNIEQQVAPGLEALKKGLSGINVDAPANSLNEFSKILKTSGMSADDAGTTISSVAKLSLNDLKEKLDELPLDDFSTRIDGVINQLMASEGIDDFNTKAKDLDAILKEAGVSVDGSTASTFLQNNALETLNGTLAISQKLIVGFTSSIDTFNKNIQGVVDKLSFGFDKINTQTDNFQKRVNAIFAGTGEVTIGRSVNGLAAGAGVADRNRTFAQLEQSSSGDISGLSRILVGLQNTPDIAEKFLRGTGATGADGGSVAQNFAGFVQKEIGLKLPDQVVKDLGSFLTPGKTREAQGVTPRALIEEAVKSGDLSAFGESVAKVNEGASALGEGLNKEAELIEKQVNFRLQILSKQRQVEEKLIKQQEDRAQRLTSLRGGTTDPLAQARSSQAGQLSRLGFSGGDVSSISAARDKALKEQEAASKDVTAATQAGKDRLLELADEVARSTEALKILSDQSKTLAAIEAKAAELKRKEQLETAGIEQLLDEAFAAAQQGDPRVLQELNARLVALDAADRGVATLPQAILAREFSGTAAGQGVLGGEKAEALRSQLTDQLSSRLQQGLKGGPFAAVGKTLEVLGKRREDSRFEQRAEAERFRAVAEQEQAAGRASADIDNAAIAAAESRAATEDPSQIFSNAVDNFAKAVGVFVAPPAPTPTAPPLAPGAIPTPSAPAVKGPSGIELAASPEKFGLAGQVGGAIGRGLGAASGVVSSLFQKGPKPEPPSQLDQIRQANRSRFEQEREAKRTGFRRQQLERREAAGTLTSDQTTELSKLRNPGEEIKKGSEEGANAFTQVFTAFAEKLPEQISAILEPVQIVGTDSMGEAIGKQLLPQIEQMIQSMINPNEGVPTPKAGAGT